MSEVEGMNVPATPEWTTGFIRGVKEGLRVGGYTDGHKDGWVKGLARGLFAFDPEGRETLPRQDYRRWVEGLSHSDYWKLREYRGIQGVVLRTWERRCALCTRHKATQVHHRNPSFYEHPSWRLKEDFLVLIPLCDDCHARHHGKVSRIEANVQAELERLRELNGESPNGGTDE